MKPVKFFAAFILMLVISTATNAQVNNPSVQHRRTEQGVRSGELTSHEVRQQKRIRHERRHHRRHHRRRRA